MQLLFLCHRGTGDLSRVNCPSRGWLAFAVKQPCFLLSDVKVLRHNKLRGEPVPRLWQRQFAFCFPTGRLTSAERITNTLQITAHSPRAIVVLSSGCFFFLLIHFRMDRKKLPSWPTICCFPGWECAKFTRSQSSWAGRLVTPVRWLLPAFPERQLFREPQHKF